VQGNSPYIPLAAYRPHVLAWYVRECEAGPQTLPYHINNK
jgi:hypothetical protein